MGTFSKARLPAGEYSFYLHVSLAPSFLPLPHRLSFQSVVESYEEVTAPHPHSPCANPSPPVFQALGHLADTTFRTFLGTFHADAGRVMPSHAALLPTQY